MARQWSKAVQIVDMLNPSQAVEHYQLLAAHFASSRELSMAEKYFLKADMAQVRHIAFPIHSLYSPFMESHSCS